MLHNSIFIGNILGAVKNTLPKNATTKTVVQAIVGENKKIENIWQCFDWGRFKNPITHPFQTRVKLYNTINPTNTKRNTQPFLDYITCYKDKQRNLEKVVIYNTTDKSINIYDSVGKQLRAYTGQESIALMRYKHDSKSIHKYLRYGQKTTNEVEQDVKTITELFKNPQKCSIAEEDFYVYRALDSKTLQAVKEALKSSNKIIEDSSFVSVATKKSSIIQFLSPKNCNYIMRIKIPKGSSYINMDEIGHSVIYQTPENELLLNKGAKFIVNMRKNGIVESEYIPK